MYAIVGHDCYTGVRGRGLTWFILPQYPAQSFDDVETFGHCPLLGERERISNNPAPLTLLVGAVIMLVFSNLWSFNRAVGRCGLPYLFQPRPANLETDVGVWFPLPEGRLMPAKPFTCYPRSPTAMQLATSGEPNPAHPVLGLISFSRNPFGEFFVSA